MKYEAAFHRAFLAEVFKRLDLATASSSRPCWCGTMIESMSLIVRNVLFTLVVPGLVGVLIPWSIMARGGTTPQPVVWPAVVVIALGVGLYLWCLWLFASVGRGTPGPWDPPRRFVALGPYRWVRNPIYIGVLLVVVGQAWLFLAQALLVYALVLAIVFHLVVIGYEEPTLRDQFGPTYDEYRRSVSRWIPRRP